MFVKVKCPSCGKELKAPDDLVGRRVLCPRCEDSFRVGSSAGGGQEIEVPAADIQTAEVMDDTATVGKRKAVEATDPSNRNVPVPTGSDHQQPVQPPPIQRNAEVATVRPRPPRITRTVKQARFVADQVAETGVQLGADGQLPSLALQDEERKDVEDKASQSSNPLLLIGALCFSITMSLIMLVVEPGGAASDPGSKDEARLQIKGHYMGESASLKPYERKLREAIQAHHRGDNKTERARYREVLNMLHDESNPIEGLTGDPERDRHLKDQLGTLLSKE
jgi:hypothetical protein